MPTEVWWEADSNVGRERGLLAGNELWLDRDKYRGNAQYQPFQKTRKEYKWYIWTAMTDFMNNSQRKHQFHLKRIWKSSSTIPNRRGALYKAASSVEAIFVRYFFGGWGMVRYGPVTSAMVRYGWSADEIKDPEKSCSLFGPALSFHSPSLSNFPKLPETGPKHQLPKFSKQGRKGRGNRKIKPPKKEKNSFLLQAVSTIGLHQGRQFQK